MSISDSRRQIEILEEFADAARTTLDRSRAFENQRDANRIDRSKDRAADWLWKNVDRRGGPDACWPIREAVRFTGPTGSSKTPRHVAWWVEHGSLPPLGSQLGVTCSNQLCCNPRHITLELSEEERFWSKVDKSAGEDACWPWTGTRSGNGVTMFWSRTQGSVRARRFVWKLTKGSEPGNQLVLGRCLNQLCMNPAHLFLGTQLDKARQAHESGTTERVRQKNIARAKGTRSTRTAPPTVAPRPTPVAPAAVSMSTMNVRDRVVSDLGVLLEQARAEVARIETAIRLVTGQDAS